MLLTAFSSFVLWKLPTWIASYTRETEEPESKQQAQPTIVEASRAGVCVSPGIDTGTVLNDLAKDDDSVYDNDAIEAVSSSQQKQNALVVGEVYNGVYVCSFLLWILPVLAAACYSHVQCDSNCDHGTCSLLSGCSVCQDGYVGQFCQYAPAYRFANCSVASHCGTYVRVESIYDDLDLNQVCLATSCPLCIVCETK